MASYSFTETKIFRVTPGKLSRYFDKETDAISGNVGKSFASTASSRPTLVPARLKLNIKLLKISTICMNHIRKQHSGDIFIRLKWTFFDFHEIITSPEKLENNTAKFDFTSKYPMEIDNDFLKKLSENPLVFELYAVCDGKEIFLSVAQYYLDNILEVANYKHETTIIFTSDLIDSFSEGIAHLDIWYKFNCKQKTLKTLFSNARIPVKKKKSVVKLGTLLKSSFLNKKDMGTVQVTESEIDHFSDGLFLVLNRNKVLKTTPSDIALELKQRVRWLRFEANWKQTLQEHAILHGRDPKEVAWRQWREEDTANVRLRTYHDKKPQVYKPEIVITVKKLIFFEGSAPIRNDSIRQIYVEYSFLGFKGPEMETPFTMPKLNANEDVVFNFRKIFKIDVKKNRKFCMALCQEIKRNGKIKFMVISEPIEDPDVPIQTCSEIGYAEVLLAELIQLEDNSDTFEYEIVDINNPIAVVGYLTIKIEGILAMRKMALSLMAPKGYNLYM